MALNPDYCTLAEMRSYLRITDVADTADDTLISLAISTASRAIDEATDRQFGVTAGTSARYYVPIWSREYGRWIVNIDDLMTNVGLVVKTDLDNDATYETTITDYRLWPLEAATVARPWTTIVFGSTTSLGYFPGGIEVTGTWGWTAVPSTIKLATLLQASRFYKRRDSPYGVAGSPDMGNELRLLAKLDPDVYLMVQPYRAWSMLTSVG